MDVKSNIAVSEIIVNVWPTTVSNYYLKTTNKNDPDNHLQIAHSPCFYDICSYRVRERLVEICI